MQMQEDGKFFEMAQLGDWITKLQPHADHVWRVTAWNMSYNISVKFDGIKTPHVRWHWVKRGIELIRDGGLKYNPHSAHLYHELAWHFQHKVGHNLDDAHRYYKSAWCMEMMHDPGPDGRRGTEDDIFDGGVIGNHRRTCNQAAHQPPAQQKPEDIGQRIPADDERAEADQHRIDDGERKDESHGASARLTGPLHR